MTILGTRRAKTMLMAASAALALVPAIAQAQQSKPATFDIQAEDLGTALTELARQSGREIYFSADLTRGKKAPRLHGQMPVERALQRLLANTGLRYRMNGSGSIIVEIAAGNEPTAADGAAPSADSSTPASSDIVVTGTNIRGANPTSPVTTITRRDIDRSGYIGISDLAASLPQNFGGGASQTVNSGFTRGGSQYNQSLGTAFNLRGLGPGATLTLLNGRRVAPAGRGTFVDITAIPLAMVQRVDVLTDGASAIYGSDAVGGVVNIITNDRFDGAETRLQAGTVTSGGRQEYSASQVIGRNWATGNLTLGVDYSRQTPLLGRDRSYAATRSGDDYLLPSQSEVSGVLGFRQKIGETVEFGVDALYSTRGYARNDGSVPSYFQEGRSRSVSLTAFATVDVFSDWQIRAGTDFSRSPNRTSVTGGGVVTPEWDSYRNLSGDIVANGTLFRLPGGGVKLAAGGSYRSERSTFNSPPTLEKDSRSVTSLFAELSVPIFSEENSVPGFRSLTIQAAGRYDRYSDVGKTINPKLGVKWSPVKHFSLRASYSESFRAPYFYETSGGNYSFLLDLPDPKSTRPDGLTTALVYYGTNPNLKPETAKTYTIGADWTPPLGRSTRISINYFNIQYRGKIVDLSADALFQVLPQEDVYRAYIDRNPSDDTVRNLIMSVPTGVTDFNKFIFNRTDVDNILSEYKIGAICDCRIQNAASLNVRGFDLQMSSSFSAGGGVLDLTFQGTLYTNYSRKVTADAPAVKLLNTVFNPIDFKARAGAFWSNARLTFGGYVNYANSYRDPGDGVYSLGGPLKAWTTVDLQASYLLGSAQGKRLADGLTIALSVNNALDTDPPHVHAAPMQLGYDPENASPRGRFVAVSLTKKW